jgi:hypothetical protein
MLFLWLSIVILSGSSFSSVVFGYVPFDSVIIMQQSNQGIHYYKEYGSFISVSTAGSESDDTEYICNKLFETCNIDADSEDNISSGTEDSQNNSDDIVNKYFEQDSDTNIPLSTINETELAETPANVTTNILNETELAETPENLTETPNFETYENSEVGINMTYPLGWEKIENSTERFSAISFLSPKEGDDDMVQERFLVRVNNQPTDLSLDDYSEKVNESLSNNTNFRIDSFETTFLSDNPAYSLIGASQEGDQNLQVIDMWTIKDGIVYRIVFYSEDAKTEMYAPVVQKIIDSFKITR